MSLAPPDPFSWGVAGAKLQRKRRPVNHGMEDVPQIQPHRSFATAAFTSDDPEEGYLTYFYVYIYMHITIVIVTYLYRLEQWDQEERNVMTEYSGHLTSNGDAFNHPWALLVCRCLDLLVSNSLAELTAGTLHIANQQNRVIGSHPARAKEDSNTGV